MRRRKRSLKRVQQAVDEVPFWWHSLDLGGGVVTPGFKSQATLAEELGALGMPRDLTGKTVLDIGGWDGFFAFEAERRGAARVAVVDHYQWSMDLGGWWRYWQDCRARNLPPSPYHEQSFWHPDSMPGKRGFDTAREALASRVEGITVDFMETNLESLGAWDIVLYLGVLYHMEDPLRALKRVGAVTRERVIIETEAVVIPGYEHEALWRFFPGHELNYDVSNWWAPNMSALVGALRPAGFDRPEVMLGPAREQIEADGGPHHFRAIVHGIKDRRET